MSIFVEQGYSTITLDTGIDITAATVTRILYKNPSGVTGYFTASVVETTKLRFQLTDTSITANGPWQLQAYVEIGGLNAYGEIVTENIESHL